jgi:hypothetical protein
MKCPKNSEPNCSDIPLIFPINLLSTCLHQSRKCRIPLWRLPGSQTNHTKACESHLRHQANWTLFNLQLPRILSAVNSQCHTMSLLKFTSAEFLEYISIPKPNSWPAARACVELWKYNFPNPYLILSFSQDPRGYQKCQVTHEAPSPSLGPLWWTSSLFERFRQGNTFYHASLERGGLLAGHLPLSGKLVFSCLSLDIPGNVLTKGTNKCSGHISADAP